ncbi:MAG: lysophospholipase [Candidatus Obscuribacterales bacterium]|nr:lysophospholipase [Candidatus Obscuribacterales bacterium]
MFTCSSPKNLASASLTVAIACSLLSSAPAYSQEIIDFGPIAQLMEMERPMSPGVEPVPSAGPNVLQAGVNKHNEARTQHPHKALDATPVMCWIDDATKPKAIIVCVHGLGLHKGTYSQFGERMAKSGYAIYAMDVRGFGSFMELPGERQCDFPKCLDDVRAALDMVHQAHPGLPVFLLGESMGGAIALRVTAMHPELVDGLISSVPAAERYGQGKSTMKVGFKLLTSPNKEMNVSDMVVNQSTQKAELREEWSKDPLARFMLTPKELVQFQQFMVANEHSAKNITKTPVLMVQGTSDRLVKHTANEHIIKQIPSPDAQLVFVDSAEHLIFEEGQFNDGVITLVSEWLKSHMAPSPVATSQ